MSDDAVCTIVGSEPQAARLRARGGHALARSSLRARLLEKLAPAVCIADGILGRLALSRVLAVVASREELTLGVAQRGGDGWRRFVDAAGRALATLRRCDGAAALRQLAHDGDARARLLAHALEAVDAELARVHVIDESAADGVLARALKEASPAHIVDVLGTNVLEAHDLVRWEPSELAWWRALDEQLARLGGGAVIVLPSFDLPLDAHRSRGPLDLVSEAVAAGIDGAPMTEIIDSPLGDLSLAGHAPVGVRDRVELVRASDARAQAEAVADAVRRALSRGVAPERVAVVLPERDETTLAPLRAALEEAVALAVDSAPEPASHCGIAAFARSAYAIAARGAQQEDAVAIARSGYVEARLRDAPPALAEILERAASGRTARERAACAASLWDELGLAPPGASLGPSPPQYATDAVARDARGWAWLQGGLQAYVRAASLLGIGEQCISAEEFLYDLESWQSEEQPSGTTGSSSLRLGLLGELGAAPLYLLVVLDATEDRFPEGPSNATLLTSALHAKLRQAGVAVPHKAMQGAAGLAELALAAAQAERILFVYSERDARETPQEPSPVVAWLEAGGARCSAWRELGASGSAVGVPPSVLRRAAMERRREEFFAGGGTNAGVLPADERAAHVLCAETGGGAVPMPTTALERFADCPFQGYAAQILRVRERRRFRRVPDALEEGSLAHSALAAAFEETASLWLDRPRDAAAIRARAARAVEAFLEPRAAGLRQIVADAVRRDVARMVDASLGDERWDFAMAERPFGDGSGVWGPVRLEHGNVHLLLKGTIDRVDLARDGRFARVIEYKLGERTSRRHARDLGTRSFQLPVYARAVSNAYADREVAGRYAPIRLRSIDRAPPCDDDWPQDWDARALALVERVRSGQFNPKPADKSVCARCGFDGGCRKPRFAIASGLGDGVRPEADG